MIMPGETLKGPLIIGVSGQARHGKDTISDYLVTNYGFTKLFLAQPIKEVCQTIFSLNEEQLYGELKEVVDIRWGISPREILQFVGTELFRNRIGDLLPEVGDAIWVKCLIEKVKSIIERDPGALIVISDVRFLNEWQEISKLPYKKHCIRVYNPRIVSKTQHVSEKLDWLADSKLENAGTILELYAKIDEFMSEKKIV